MSHTTKRPFFAFEHRRQPIVSSSDFVRRLIIVALLATALLGGWLLIGVLGYHLLADLSWVDAFLNAAMIVGGMGPIDVLHSPGSKLFAGIYAIMSGVVFLTTFGLLLAPVFHRFLHHFHWEDQAAANNQRPGSP